MTFRTHSRYTSHLVVAIAAVLLFTLLAGTAVAQDGAPPAQGTIEQYGHATQGEWNHQDDGRLNASGSLGGLSVYCVDQWKNSATTYEGGGGIRVLDPQGEEMLFVSEETINAGWAQLQQTGEYVTLGLSPRGWYGGAQVGLYLLTTNEYQLNAADEWGKPVNFVFSGCRNFTVSTGDGCSPGWDRDSSGACVYKNLY